MIISAALFYHVNCGGQAAYAGNVECNRVSSQHAIGLNVTFWVSL